MSAAGTPAAATPPAPSGAPNPAPASSTSPAAPDVPAGTPAAPATVSPTPAPASIIEGGLKADLTKGEDGADKNARTAAAAIWPEDWREQMSGGNEAVKKVLDRYASPATAAKAFQALRTRLDSGEFVKPLPTDATEDEVAKWRKNNGVPDKPEGYELPKGLEIGADDKPIVDSFLQFAHTGNKPPTDVQATLDWFFRAREEQAAVQFEKDKAIAEQNEEILRAEYGNEYRGNLNGIKGFMQNTFGDDVTRTILSARDKDGVVLGSRPDFFKAMAQLSRELNPAATVTLPAGTYGGKGVDARLAELDGLMAKDINAWQSAANKPTRDEYIELQRVKEKMAARDGGRKAA